MYADDLCCVRYDGQRSERFHVKTGLREGCVMSPLLFVVAIDRVMKKATGDQP